MVSPHSPSLALLYPGNRAARDPAESPAIEPLVAAVQARLADRAR